MIRGQSFSLRFHSGVDFSPETIRVVREDQQFPSRPHPEAVSREDQLDWKKGK